MMARSTSTHYRKGPNWKKESQTKANLNGPVVVIHPKDCLGCDNPIHAPHDAEEGEGCLFALGVGLNLLTNYVSATR